MPNNQIRKIVRKDYYENESAEVIRISNHFVDSFLFQDNVASDIPINALRIIFNIISIIRNHQFMPDNQPKQLSLFDAEYETDHNIFAAFKIRNSKISEKRSSKQVVEAYEYLATFKMGWYVSKNLAGKDIKTFGGLISLPSYEDRGYTSFLVSSFWLKKLVVLSDYNNVLYQLVYNIRNNKHVLFAIWLAKIPQAGTHVKLETFNQKFNVNYIKANDFCVKFLRPIRLQLNIYNQVSFNYKYEKELIFIIPYNTKNIKEDVLSQKLNEKRLIIQRFRYFVKRYSLERINLERFSYNYKEIIATRTEIEKAYIIFKKNNRANGNPSTQFKGMSFLQEMQSIIIQLHRDTETGKRLPNAYPIIL